MKDTLPFIEYTKEDLSIYPLASTALHPVTKDNYLDKDNDFLIGGSGGFLMNMNFIFINTKVFTEAGDHFVKYGKYTLAPKGSVEFNRFYSKEAKRRRVGMTANCKLYKKDIDKYINAKSTKDAEALLHPLTITGDHYHYLNYGRLERTLNKQEKEEYLRKGITKKTTVGFPRFWDGDYWNFKADRFCVLNGFNLCKGKARRKGYSFKRANQGANTLNLNKDTSIVLAAYEEKYLTDKDGTSWMLKIALDWLENETYWKRNYVKEDLSDLILGYKLRGEGNKIFGWNSNATSVALRANSSAAAGKGADEIDFEEAGICPNLEEAISVTESVTESGAIKRGILRVYGTAGTKEANWIDFGRIFYKPSLHKMMPFENVWDKNSRTKVCGFFHPQVWNLEPYMDEHGNSLLDEAYEYDKADKELAEQEKDASDFMTYNGQRANSPADAFKSGRDNLFSSPGLVEVKHALEFDPDKRFFRDGMVLPNEQGKIIFKTNAQLENEGSTWHPYIEDFPLNLKKDVHGCVREFHPPYRDSDGNIPKELYYLAYDTVDKDKSQKELIIKNSINSIGVWMYPNNISNSPGDILVAMFAGRPNTMEEADRILLYLCMYYNAKALVEVNAGETIPNFRRWGKLHYLYKDPTSIIDRKENEVANAPYGITIGGTDKLEDGLRYLRDFMYTPVGVDEDGTQKYNYHYIPDLPFATELLEFGGTGTFDRISMSVVAMYQRMAYRTKRKDKKQERNYNQKKNIFEEINLYNMNDIIR